MRDQVTATEALRRGDWMETYSGIKFYPMDPRPEEVALCDIAHALAFTCRFGGHINRYFSVAQHSIIVSHLVPEEFALQGLMHDAPEAYIGDMVKPLKIHDGFFTEVDGLVWTAICARFDIPWSLTPEVKRADIVALVTERRDLKTPSGHDWGKWTQSVEPMPGRIIPVSPEVAELMFLSRFEELTGYQP